MVDTMIIDVDAVGGREDLKMNGQSRARKTQKRKRVSFLAENLCKEEKEAQIEALRKELDGLFGYYKEVTCQKVDSDMNDCVSNNAVIAALMEESELPLSRLVHEIYGKLNKIENGSVRQALTMASVKASVLSIGQRLMYGVFNADADVLEDDSESCLWCWETRDVKLIPEPVRGLVSVRRICRKKIHERITAVSAIIAALQKLESDLNYKHELINASEKLGKASTEEDIRIIVNLMLEKNISDMAGKNAKREEKLLIKQLERNRRDAEKLKKRMDRELQKEKWQAEKHMKLLQGKVEKDETHNEKEVSEMRKQQEEAEKNQRRREKEAAEMKKKLSLQKQVSMMERFLKRSKTSPSCHHDQLSTKADMSDSSIKKSENVSEAVTLSMDCALASSNEINSENIWKSHLSSWRCIGQSIFSNRRQHWGLRQKPKTEPFKQFKLTASRELARDNDLSTEKLVDGWGERFSDDRSCPDNEDSFLLGVKKCNWGKQLLQFDKSHRPAFYGIWPKKSHVVGPRRPFMKDPGLDYDIDSDTEWEEEDPGESLSDCDKDEDESLEGCSKSDEDESEDGFFVPDGYLSENEGVQVDRMEMVIKIEEAQRSPVFKQEKESEEFCALLRHQKYLNNLTEHTLRKNQPLIISNLMHDKSSLLLVKNLSGTLKLEQMCMEALSMRGIPGGSPVQISKDNMQYDEQEACLSCGNAGAAPISLVTATLDSNLPEIVSSIQTCSHGINKVLESLQQKFPHVPKSALRNKVREISDFVDNCWKVKKEILDKLGLAKVSPEKSTGVTKGIATFFSKRCLPPTERVNPGET
ncbi:Chromatin assembly factor 1 subunit FAS1 [Quillaja saponaria]|uniref:Chromatin assembly factor 1 subunit FAS1 n=1 Tax=Quillaja saponaria TaxID=32244 RepID=A0AAD7Q2J3_QUISA|nr:Chromatin assembly factor 1 subunit FAS1 [Quillaja saponaria]